MTDPLVCQLCGGRRPSYRSSRSDRWITQYRKCERCGDTTKTRRWVPVERQLTANEIASIPFAAELVIDPQRFDVFILVKPK